MSVTIKGLDKLKRDLTNAIKSKLPYIAADVYLDEIKQNIKPFTKTGNLSKSFKVVKRGAFKAVIESNAPYAAIQNFGGKIRITEKMRKKMWALYYETGNEMFKHIAITKKKSITIKAKNYIDIQSKRKYFQKVDVRFNKITKNI